MSATFAAPPSRLVVIAGLAPPADLDVGTSLYFRLTNTGWADRGCMNVRYDMI